MLLIGTAALAAASLAACRGEPAKLATQDDGLASNDPAVKGALQDDIMVDENQTNSSNATAATAGPRPASGAVPSARGGGAPALALADARESVGGTMLHAPAAGRFEDSCDRCNQPAVAQRPATLGGLARQQAGGSCGADVRYGNDWATRLPATFPVYPRASLVEAAGVANGRCNVRIVNFRTRVGLQAVLDYYYTRAVRAGYSAEHLVKVDQEHYLGGTKGDEAFVVMVRQLDQGLIDVDLVATGGR